MKNNFIIDMTKEIKKCVIQIPEMWRGSKHELWFRNNNYAKGAHGAYAYKKFLKNKGYQVEIISDEGDLRYKKNETDLWIKSEVKASKADLRTLKRPENFVAEKLWFNQLRPKQKGWEEAVLVGFYPNHIRIWRKSRKDWDKQCDTITSTNKVLEHVGTNELRGVMLEKNSRRNNFHEWECIHNDQQGGLL
jgi:hypothetical protein